MKKGFSLIEVVLVFSLISVICGITCISLNGYRAMNNKINSEFYIDSIVDYISNARQYCREKNTLGKIMLKKEEGVLVFKVQGEEINRLDLEGNLKFDEIAMNGAETQIKINQYGKTSNTGTICLKDMEGETHIITICVGTSYVRIKK